MKIDEKEFEKLIYGHKIEIIEVENPPDLGALRIGIPIGYNKFLVESVSPRGGLIFDYLEETENYNKKESVRFNYRNYRIMFSSKNQMAIINAIKKYNLKVSSKDIKFMYKVLDKDLERIMKDKEFLAKLENIIGG